MRTELFPPKELLQQGPNSGDSESKLFRLLLDREGRLRALWKGWGRATVRLQDQRAVPNQDGPAASPVSLASRVCTSRKCKKMRGHAPLRECPAQQGTVGVPPTIKVSRNTTGNREQGGLCGLQRKVNLSKGASDQKMAWGRLRGLGTHCQALQKANPYSVDGKSKQGQCWKSPPRQSP